MKHSISSLCAAALACALLVLGCTGSKERSEPSPDDAAQIAKAEALVKEGYKLKQLGENGGALGKFIEACGLLEKSAGERSVKLASCLDDQASVHLRLGNADKASKLFERAFEMVMRSPDADSPLARGLAIRRELVRQLAAQKVTCSEPEVPPADSPLPYFPVVTEMQDALGMLTPQVADCLDGAPKLVTMRLVITGDGRPVVVESRGPDYDTPLGKCIADRLMKLVPRAELPRFRACFRGFVYPFTVGNYEGTSDAGAPAS